MTFYTGTPTYVWFTWNQAYVLHVLNISCESMYIFALKNPLFNVYTWVFSDKIFNLQSDIRKKYPLFVVLTGIFWVRPEFFVFFTEYTLYLLYISH